MRSGASDYSDVALASLVDGASPHRLVEILYDELLKTIDLMLLAAARGMNAQAMRARTKAVTILAGLDSGLDLAAGGELAVTLRRFYRGAAGTLGRVDLEAGELERLRVAIAEVAESWRAIDA